MSAKKSLFTGLLLASMLALAGCGGVTPSDDFLNQEVFIPSIPQSDETPITARDLFNFYQPACSWEALTDNDGYIMRVKRHDQLTGEDRVTSFMLAVNYDKPRKKSEVQLTTIVTGGEQYTFPNLNILAWTIIKDVVAQKGK